MKYSPLKYTTSCFILIVFTSLSAFAQERIVNGTFEGMPAGSPPEKPWLAPAAVKGTSGILCAVEPMPGDKKKMAVQLRDETPDAGASIHQNFAEVKKGRLTLKLQFKRIGSAFGIYLGPKNVSRYRAIDLKVLKGGALSMGKGGERTKAGFNFEAGTPYSLYIDFETSADGSKITYKVGLRDKKKVLAEGEGDATQIIEALRIGTDSKDTETDVFVTDISLVAG
jgi:hypothetical protein